FKALEVNTANHSLVLGLKIKNKPNGDMCVIYLYDPNHTATHQRVEYSIINQNKIKKLKANDFFDEKHKKSYGLVSDGVSIFIDRHKPMSISSIIRYLNNLFHPKVIHHAMSMGLTEIILKVAEDMQILKLMGDEMESLLAARNNDGYYGLAIALQNGHADTIQAYGELIKKAELNPDKIADILQAKVKIKLKEELKEAYVFGLSLALQNGHAHAIRVYGELLNANSAVFDHDKLVELLAAHSVDGAGHRLPALYLALQHGYADAVLAYGELLKAATLSLDETAILLAAKRFDNVPGLLIASNNGHSEAVLAYGKLLKNSCLTADKTAELLAAKNNDGVSALLIALQNGHDEVIRAYGQIINDLEFSPTETEQLLVARCESGLTGLFLALKYGQVNAACRYGELLRSAGLSPYNVAECLAAKGVDGQPGICMAYQNGDTDTMLLYAGLIDYAGVTAEEIAEHLSEEQKVYFLDVVNECQKITL
ncbi:ShET2/EspL2 family type III secretion system effector toxin, partial [Salmonella enterica]|nr:ShET2/EspL2 family type III secretion system effector toxin [Salmonella enterica]EKO1581790.1 ShET2/EspL2 family type III secretion system effector toxin [Salmonella enterica]